MINSVHFSEKTVILAKHFMINSVHFSEKTVILAKYSVSNCQPFQTWALAHPYTGVACTISGQKDGKAFTVNFWSLHLHFLEYGPDRVCLYKLPIFEYYREQQIIELTQRNPRFQSDSAQSGQIPVIVSGDFNSPSHLDWGADTANQHCGKTVEWPVTKMFENLLFSDTYR
jgi:hypothetical protein